jgi:hypothetical protein
VHGARHLGPDLVVEGEQALGLAEEPLARAREAQASPVAGEERMPELVFQPLDLLAYRGLREIEDVGGGGHARRLGHGHEGTQERGVEVAAHDGSHR